MVTSSYLARHLIETAEILLKGIREDHQRWSHIDTAVKVLSELQVRHAKGNAEGGINDIGDIIKGGGDEGGPLSIVQGEEIVKENTDDGGQNPIHPPQRN